MKKHILAVAVGVALAAPAMAQNVSVYGVINATIASTKLTTSTGSTTATTQGSEDYTSSSVLGFRGTEDLGGGLKAFWNLESDINVGNGQMGAQHATAVGQVFFNRLSFVGIEGAFGKVSLGRVSDAVDSLEGYSNFVNLFDTETAGANGIGGKNGNSARYDSPAFMGMNLIATYSSNAVSTDGATNIGNAVKTVGLTYNQGPLSVGAAKGEANVDLAAKKGEVSTVYAGYNLGFADLRVQYTSDETSASLKYTTNEVSANIPLGAGLSAIVHFEDAAFNGTNTGTTADYKQFGVLVRKDLSKRTHAYAGYRKLDREATASTDTTVTAIGLAHSF